jgi:mitochondrial import receptor subunit TOM22
MAKIVEKSENIREDIIAQEETSNLAESEPSKETMTIPSHPTSSSHKISEKSSLTRTSQRIVDAEEEVDIDDSHEIDDPLLADIEDQEDWERDETWLERVLALKEMIPESTRNNLSTCFTVCRETFIKTTKFTGRWAWITSTSLLLVGLPLILEMEKEQVLFEFEAAQYQQQTAQQMLQGSSTSRL